jgi:photolyase PhrII
MISSHELTDSLPPSLAERTRLTGRQELDASGEFVLYWMRTAIRVDENPALSVAIKFANRLGLPLLVYQGLTERYPFASDRHHTFVLQGARDVQLAFAEKYIIYALYVERPGHRGPHLRTLAQRAAVVVTEDMPTEPLRSWTTGLSRVIQCSLFVVDTACIVPMRLVGKSHDRAFAFRNATQKLYEQRVSAVPSECELETPPPHPLNLPFEPVNLQTTDIASLVSQCEIDHSIGPVPHTPGGSTAGYQRWQDFKQKGLSTYENRRNNALVDGVSRLSPYLHYGMVAPTRIAREAAAEKSKGAEKFLDELLIWRELAYVFCHYRSEHGRLSAIPAWARETLAAHATDARELKSWETMSRGRTGDSIWDSAQRSLLIHGELHNNVRMTWGKSILNWTPDAKQALLRLIDLNHRYALDGRDPSSYGGILWCLGQFDRPFLPPQPVFGTVRTRSTEQHAERLDPTAYRRTVTRPLWDSTPRIAVIGTGISGLICARTLVDHGCDVTLFEKSRGVGGRMSTRRVDENLSFDHGAQYFTARDERFQRYVESWIEDGYVAPWDGRIVVIEQGILQAEKSSAHRYVAVPGMSSLGKHLASGLNVHLEHLVVAPERSNDQWLLRTADGNELGQIDIVVVAVPSHQAATLLSSSPDLADLASRVKMNGCWALMLAFENSLGLGFDGAFVQQPPLSWIARNNSKPGRTDRGETWVVHATPQWTEAHIEDSPQQVSKQLLDEFWIAVGKPKVEPYHLDIQRWRFAIPESATTQMRNNSARRDGSLGNSITTVTQPCLFDEQRWIGACGDWCAGARVEGAFLSGMAIAGRILGRLNATSGLQNQVDKQLEPF